MRNRSKLENNFKFNIEVILIEVVIHFLFNSLYQ
jgi:hypothetical protein